MYIKKLEEPALKEAIDLVWEVFNEFEAPEYSIEGVNEFKSFIANDSIKEMYESNKITFWGCYDDEKIVGVISVRGIGHICLLFVKKVYHRQGIAKNLFKTVLKEYEGMDVKEITVNSSTYATEVYHRLGFKDKDSEQVLNGIRFTPMAYKIADL